MSFIKKYWPDLLILIALWTPALAYIDCLNGPWRSWDGGSPHPGNIHLIERPVLLAPLFCALWLPVRLIYLIYWLTDKQRREHMAITPLPAGRYLARHLMPLILFAAANHTAWIAAAIARALIALKIDFPHSTFIDPAYLHEERFYLRAGGLCLFFIYLAGVLGMLCRCCRRRSADAVFILGVYIVVCLALLSLWYYLLPPIFNGSLRPPMFPYLFYYFFPGALGLLFAWRHWCEACEAYYRFD